MQFIHALSVSEKEKHAFVVKPRPITLFILQSIHLVLLHPFSSLIGLSFCKEKKIKFISIVCDVIREKYQYKLLTYIIHNISHHGSSIMISFAMKSCNECLYVYAILLTFKVIHQAQLGYYHIDAYTSVAL